MYPRVRDCTVQMSLLYKSIPGGNLLLFSQSLMMSKNSDLFGYDLVKRHKQSRDSLEVNKYYCQVGYGVSIFFFQMWRIYLHLWFMKFVFSRLISYNFFRVNEQPLLMIAFANHRERNTLEPRTECYANDKVKSPPVFRSFYDDF